MRRRPVHPMLFANRAVPTIGPLVPVAHGARPIDTIVTIGTAKLSASRTLPKDFASSIIDPADELVAFMERLAICMERRDMSESFAHRVASDQCNATLDALVGRQLAFWRDRLKALPQPIDERLAGLKSACLAALCERWVIDAVRLGWDVTSMFGLDPTAPDGEDRNGLAVRIAIERFEAPSQIVAIDANVALISRGGGRSQRHFNAGDVGPVIWEHPRFRRLH